MLTVEEVIESFGEEVSTLGYGRRQLATWLSEKLGEEYTEHFARRLLWNIDNLPRVETRIRENADRRLLDTRDETVEERLRAAYGFTDKSWVPVSIWGEPSHPRAKWVRKIAGSVDPEQVVAWLEKTQVAPPLKAQVQHPADQLAVLSIRDSHFGMFTEYAGPDYELYDLDEAYEAYVESGQYLMSKALESGATHLVIPFGSDMIHVDGDDNATTKGTQQDMSAQWWQALEMAVKALNHVVKLALSDFETVTLVLESGNHDNGLSRVLSIAMRQRWSDGGLGALDILDMPGSIKRVSIGKCHLFFHHGDGIAPDAYPGLIAGDHPDTVAAGHYVEVLSGHLHHRRRSVLGRTGDYLEAGSIVHRITPALCPSSNWAESKGYRSTPGAQLTTYDQSGLVALFEWTPTRGLAARDARSR